MLNGKCMYVGETENWRMGRPTRVDSDAGEFDEVVILKACKDKKRRMYWEAFLVCKLNPANQVKLRYDTFILNRNMENKEPTPETIDNLKRSKFLIRERAKAELDSLRRRNNRERLVYWLDQVEQAKEHLKESIKVATHFYSGFKQDQITSKNGKERD